MFQLHRRGQIWWVTYTCEKQPKPPGGSGHLQQSSSVPPSASSYTTLTPTPDQTTALWENLSKLHLDPGSSPSTSSPTRHHPDRPDHGTRGFRRTKGQEAEWVPCVSGGMAPGHTVLLGENTAVREPLESKTINERHFFQSISPLHRKK